MAWKKIAAALVIAGGGLTAAGTAYALWSSTGTGSGRAATLSAQTLTVTAVTGTADLYPGASGKLSFTLTNPNPYPVTFTAMTPGTITSSNPAQCPASNLTVATFPSGLSLTVAANATSSTLSIPAAATLALAAPDGCQNKTFDVALTLTGTQS
ncbi:MAG: hypothetical protein LC792_08615 [Actinobacteria bacterium]|nr:hypothetical protein [Actinomycetota bacterium]